MTQPRSRQLRDYLRGAQCGSDPEVYIGNFRSMVASNWFKRVAQLRQLDCAACVFCDTSRSQRCNRCSHCKKDTPTRDITVGDVLQDRRELGHQDAAAASSPNPSSSQLAASAAKRPFGRQSTSELPNSGYRCHRTRQAVPRRSSQSLSDGHSALRSTLHRCVCREPCGSHQWLPVLGRTRLVPLSLAG